MVFREELPQIIGQEQYHRHAADFAPLRKAAERTRVCRAWHRASEVGVLTPGVRGAEGKEKGKGIKVSEWLVGLGVDEVITAKGLEHRGPYYVFSDNQVKMRQTEMRHLDDITGSLIRPPEATGRAQEEKNA